jgi:ABC-type uncharacterized transport system substrate-binding protein
MFKRNILLFTLLLIITGTIIPSDIYSEEDKNHVKKVLVVHSYHPEYEWVSNISRGIKRVLESEKGILVETFYMDTQNVQSEAKIVQAGEKAKEIISQWDPDIVITVDDNTQEYVGKYYVGKARPLIVFCGVSAPLENYGYPTTNVTGILEAPTLKGAVEFLDKKITHVRSISILSDDSPMSKYSIAFARSEIESMGKKVLSCDMAGTFVKWKSKISGYQQNKTDAILIFSYDWVKDEKTGRNIAPKEVMEWSSKNSKKPIFGVRADIVDNGGLLSVMTSGIEHGREAALITLGLLNGKKISDYPVRSAQGVVVLLNRKTAERLGLVLTKELMEDVDVIVGE